jgi:hypothetical protein
VLSALVQSLQPEDAGTPAVDLMQIGDDPDTPAAARGLVSGLERLFLRLGPPPEPQALAGNPPPLGDGGRHQ